MNTSTDTQLKQALAKMLPDKIKCKECINEEDGTSYCYLVWNHPQCANHGHNLVVLDTELLHLCWLVEEQMTQGSLCAMSNELDIMHELEGKPCDASQWKHHKSWQQRVIALCKVKGVEII